MSCHMNKQIDPFCSEPVAYFGAALREADPFFEQPLIEAVENVSKSADAVPMTAAMKIDVQDGLTLEVERIKCARLSPRRAVESVFGHSYRAGPRTLQPERCRALHSLEDAPYSREDADPAEGRAMCAMKLWNLRRPLYCEARTPGDIDAVEREPRTGAKRVNRRFVRRMTEGLLRKVTR